MLGQSRLLLLVALVSARGCVVCDGCDDDYVYANIQIVGEGRVTNEDGVIDCESGGRGFCQHTWHTNTSEAITAEASPGWRFVRWMTASGEVISTEPTLILTPEDERPNTIVTVAVFELGVPPGDAGLDAGFDAAPPPPVGPPLLAAGNQASMGRSCGPGLAWGTNAVGELGIDDVANHPTPVYVPWLDGASQVDLGNKFACAVFDTGRARCTGIGDNGRLGNGVTPPPRLTRIPVDVALSVNAVQIATGERHACAVTTEGAVFCWGGNAGGELGMGTTGGDFPTPMQVGISERVSRVAAGVNCSGAVIQADGALLLWGLGPQAWAAGPAMAPHPAYTRWAPDMGPVLTGVREVGLGSVHACALLSSGVVRCWGDDEFLLSEGLLGDGPAVAPRTEMVAVEGVTTAIDLCVAPQHNCVVVAVDGGPIGTGEIRCWGGNARGQSGRTDGVTFPSPVVPEGLPTGFVEVTCGHEHTCARHMDGSIWCWGSNEAGEAGRGDMIEPAPPGMAVAPCE